MNKYYTYKKDALEHKTENNKLFSYEQKYTTLAQLIYIYYCFKKATSLILY
jgi:hypothetical protein